MVPSSEQRLEATVDKTNSELSLPEGFIDGVEVPDLPGLAAANCSIEVDPFTGAAAACIPLRLTPGRNDFGPDLDLQYNSRRGNGPFGLGWSLEVPSVSRSVRADLPRHVDDDIFEIFGDELVPSLRSSGGWMDDRFSLGDYLIVRYKRRFESCFERIERWVHQPTNQVHWRVVDRDNVTSLFGTSDESRISDPSDAHRVAEWLLAEKFDDRGNVVRYVYRSENTQGLDLESPGHRHRKDNPLARGGQRYLKRVLYGNAAPHDRGPWHFQVVFDYGDHDPTNPTLEESRIWSARPDAFVSNVAGFEIATWRRCQRVLMFHEFAELGSKPVLVSSTTFDYDDSNSRSTLVSSSFVGHIANGQSRRLPSRSFRYINEPTSFEVRTVESGRLGEALSGVEGARWNDFYDEGLPGVIFRDGDEWKFTRNLGNARFATPEPVPFEDDTPPDLTKTDIVESALAHERNYRPTTVMREPAAASRDDQYIGYLDLNGDGADDVVVADRRVIRWYPSRGQDGFADPVVVRLEEGSTSPRTLMSSVSESFHAADMTGDGLYDLVRIRNNEVTYWPGMGFGRFGTPVTFDNNPQLASSNSKKVLLADVTGTGTADVVVVTEGRVQIWRNMAGTRLHQLESVEAPGLSAQSYVEAVDLFGSGRHCVVWLDRTGGENTVRFVESKNVGASGLLIGTSNGMGLRQRVTYVSSIDLWRRDRDARREWLFTCPVSVHVVERVEVRDRVARTRNMWRYVFRNAAYEKVEQRFIGFASSEVWQGGLAEDYALPGLFRDEAVPDVPTYRRAAFKLERYWFHTGSMVDGGELTEELVAEFHTDQSTGRHRWLSGHALPASSDARTVADTHCALRGRVLRYELVDARSGVPAEVREHTTRVRQVQPARAGRPQCLDTQDLESVCVVYDNSGLDSRIEHTMVLTTDDLGYPTRSATIAYARRQPDTEAQSQDSILIRDTEWAHGAAHATWYRLGVELASTLQSVKAPRRQEAQLFDMKTIRTAANSKSARVVSRKRHIYWTNDSRSLLAPGRIESRALLARTEELAFAPGVMEKTIGDAEIADLLRMEGGYLQDEAGWWAPGETTSYDPAHFYVEIATRRAIGDETRFAYDNSFLFKVRTEDVFGNITQLWWNPRVMQWWKRLDPNGVVTTRRFDALGEMLSVTRSRHDEGDEVGPGMEASSKDNPTAVFTYRFPASGRPGWWRVRHRIRHKVSPPPLFDYTLTFDGHGEKVATATRANAGKWLVSGIRECASPGITVASGVEVFADTPLIDETFREQAINQGKRFTRDVKDRIVRIDDSLGLIETFQYGPWITVHHDATDNVLDSSWYASRHGSAHMRASDLGAGRAAMHVFEARTAAMAATHAQTPTTTLFDPWGRKVAERRRLNPGEVLEERIERDVVGSVTSLIDAKGRQVRTYRRDMLGRVFAEEALDNSPVHTVLAASGECLRRRLSSGSVVRYRYDAAGRRTHTFVSVDEDTETMVERTIWGGGEVNVIDAAANNLIGRVHMTIGSGGLEVVDSCDLNGNVTKQTLHLPVAARAVLDWSRVEEVAHSGQVLAKLASEPSMLVDEPEVMIRSFDAMGNVISSRAGNVMLGFRYGAQARLDGARVLLKGSRERHTVVDDVRYDARGNLAAAALGQSVKMRRRYDPAGRVVQLAAIGAANEGRLQDRYLIHDPGGNVSCVIDKGELRSSFAYDALGRLAKAEGFEPTEDDAEHQSRRFTNGYMLDEVGNVLSIEHTSSGRRWERIFSYESSSNRVLAASRPDQGSDAIAASYAYDENGNLTNGPSQSAFVWDHSGRLVSFKNEEVSVVYSYGADGKLLRRVVSKPGEVIEETLRWNDLIRNRRWEAGQLSEEVRRQEVAIESSPVVTVGPGASGELSVHSVLTDHLGSTMIETDGQGKPTGEWDYLPYGLKWTKGVGSPTDSVSVKTHDFRNGWFDDDAELLYLDGRWYSPWLGRYISPTNSSEFHPYVFEGANPQGLRN